MSRSVCAKCAEECAQVAEGAIPMWEDARQIAAAIRARKESQAGEGACPTCDAPQPHMHPAVQEGGEVSLCADPFHERRTPENTPDRINLVKEILRRTGLPSPAATCGPDCVGVVPTIVFDEIDGPNHKELRPCPDPKHSPAATLPDEEWIASAITKHVERNGVTTRASIESTTRAIAAHLAEREAKVRALVEAALAFMGAVTRDSAERGTPVPREGCGCDNCATHMGLTDALAALEGK